MYIVSNELVSHIITWEPRSREAAGAQPPEEILEVPRTVPKWPIERPAQIGIGRHWKQNEGMQRNGRFMWMLAAFLAWKAWKSIQSPISWWVGGLIL